MQQSPKNSPAAKRSYCSIEHNRRLDDWDTHPAHPETFAEPCLTVAEALASRRDGKPRCASLSYGWDCPQCGGRAQKPRLCGNRWECPICARIYCSTEGRKIFTRLMSFRPRAVYFITLTTDPLDIEEIWGQALLAGDYDSIENSLQGMARELIKREFGKGVAGISIVHNWATKDPLGRTHFHIHLIIPALRKENHGWVNLPAWIPPKRLETIKKAWGRSFGRTMPLNVHFEYAREDSWGQIRHWINYSIRRPVLDVNEFLLKENLSYETLTQEQVKRFLSHISPRPRFRRVRTFGFLAGGHIDKFLHSRGSCLDIAKNWASELAEEEGRIYCPHCHTDLTFMKKSYGLMSLEKTIIENVVHRKQIWKKFEGVKV